MLAILGDILLLKVNSGERVVVFGFAGDVTFLPWRENVFLSARAVELPPKKP